ncbi:leucyl/phenylalanyl-tRNA--protein transferase [Marispirochaeta aestuarii]|uniref:leucyl/phenylalanyl-tRNA--protein transferase n=1 Tax=Marispirochaeta aestuarii TaxID=1963862 RepID=UPI0029C81A6F|nr:leucyl/phenylalanyl-tRNA--protein transferase [Marispirochaeta aestuarii]
MFPYLSADDSFQFPDPREAEPPGIVASGGNLSPGMLVSAYRQGIFPWFSDEDPILWWSPDPRFVLYPEGLHVSKSMRRVLKRGVFTITFDTAFDRVIAECAARERPGQDGTWITRDMRDAYSVLHRLGIAHSAEAWQEGRLVGGLYGLSLGKIFFGESMFAHSPNASKAAFIGLVRTLSLQGVKLIDCQVYTHHLSSLGAEDIPRSRYLEELSVLLDEPGLPSSWSSWSCAAGKH